MSGRRQEKDDENFGGHVASRRNAETESLGESTTNRSHNSWGPHEEYRIPIHNHPDNELSSHISSPPRLGTHRNRKRRGTPSSKVSSYYDEFSLPPELPPIQDNSFKGWLTSSILETLNAAAGVTLATTGHIISPPLQMTKSIILPTLLALFVDTMDSITPDRVKDWLRIISSSGYHLFSVLTSTEKGQIFSTQFVIVLQDILQALSAPETRQVLVDGMACNVKLAEALHTPEMQEWLEQLSILGCRLVDAAASGKSKQLIQDTKDLAWKGIETATDPATTLGLAEFTAHMCHALEEAQNSLNPTPRAQRNAQNQTTYIKPLQMSDYPRNVSMEEIILSCLGRGGEERDDDEDATSIPSKVIWDEEQPTAGYNDQEWKERGERVDTELLKDRILRNQRPQSRRHPPPSAISSAKSSIASVGPTLESLPMIPSQDYEESVDPNHQISQEKSKGECDENIIVDQNVETIERGADIEDIAWDKLQPEIKRATRVGEDTRPSSRQKQGDDIPATLQFYRILDDMLKQKRSERLDRQVGEDATINNPSQRIPRNSSQDPFKLLKAKVRKLKKDNTQRISKATPPQGRKTFRQLSKQRQACVLFFAVVMAWVVFIWIGFAFYGMYMFINVEPTATPTNIQTESRNIPSSTNSEVVIRIVREVVHVREDGSIIETSSSDSIASEEDIEKVTECVASAFQIN